MNDSKTGIYLIIGIVVYSAILAFGIWWALERDISWISIGGVVFVLTVLVGSIALLVSPGITPKVPPDK